MKFIATSLFFLFVTAIAIAQPESVPIRITQSRHIPFEKTIFYKLGNKIIPIKISQYGKAKDVIYINVHDNETTSVEAARSILEINGGTLIKIENNKQRNIRFGFRNNYYSFDPNRIFSRQGIEQTLKMNGRINKSVVDETEKFAQRLLQLFPDSTTCIVALHNNTDGDFSINSYLHGNEKQFDAKAVFSHSFEDIDDIALTTDSLIYQKMADYRYNTIWQHNKKKKKDGSLSIYCGERNMRYINIETEHGKLSQHIKMLEKLLDILAEENISSPKAFPISIESN